MTAGVISYSSFSLRFWPKSFATQVAGAGIPTVPKSVWKQHMHDAVWPEGSTAARRVSRVVSGTLAGFWIGWLLSGGNFRRSNVALDIVLYLCYLLIVCLGVVVPFVLGSWSAMLWVLAPLIYLGLTIVLPNNPLSDSQVNWFYKYPSEFLDFGSSGPQKGAIPAALQRRITTAEAAGFGWRVAWNRTDPLLMIYPRYQPWRQICAGGWDSVNPQIDNL